MLLASLMANGDAGDAITVRIVAAAGYGDGHAATRRGGHRKAKSWCALRPFAAFFCVLMGLLFLRLYGGN